MRRKSFEMYDLISEEVDNELFDRACTMTSPKSKMHHSYARETTHNGQSLRLYVTTSARKGGHVGSDSDLKSRVYFLPGRSGLITFLVIRSRDSR